jgi:two-component system, chemotaxis family, CheB/CheR fusion protein
LETSRPLQMADNVSLQELVDILAHERALDLRGYKTTTLDRRVRRRMSALNTSSFADYLEIFRRDPREKNELLNTVLINVTQFFRDPQAWEALRTEILPKFLKNLRPGDPFRAWSAGCASGEEPFSLAILLAEHFGPRLQEFDVKIYATDIDEDALATARRGEYSAEHLRHMNPAWRDKYFHDTPTVSRIVREVRRLVIFGRSNLVSDAPISHCHLVMCRNVLIYFDADAQRHIFARLHYALEREGILFLGKAESKLSESRLFRPLNSRWRIFQRITKDAKGVAESADTVTELPMADDNKLTQEVRQLRQQQKNLLDTVKAGVMILDAQDVIISHNDAASTVWNLRGNDLTGKRVHTTELMVRCPEMASRLESSRVGISEVISFHCRLKVDREERVLAVSLRPVRSQTGERTGTIVYTDDVTMQERLQTTVEQLEATGEELQSANEELETTNEELQSTNEELETTNEELQSTNEELETTNEELQSLNEELEHMNEELERRTAELNALTERYAETLRRTPWPVLLVDREEKIQLWNAAAQQLFGVGATSVVGVDIDGLPIEEGFRKAVVRRVRTVLTSKKTGIIRNQAFSADQSFDVHFTPISRDNVEMDGVLIMFGPLSTQGQGKLVEKTARAKRD